MVLGASRVRECLLRMDHAVSFTHLDVYKRQEQTRADHRALVELLAGLPYD